MPPATPLRASPGRRRRTGRPDRRRVGSRALSRGWLLRATGRVARPPPGRSPAAAGWGRAATRVAGARRFW